MIKGLNSDVFIDGANYHIQTEDWGHQSAFILSRVYKSGAVIDSQKKSYQDLGQNLRLAMESQHQKILDLIHSGQIR